MKFGYDVLAAAAKTGMEEAGFANVQTSHFRAPHGLVISFSGDCPCGLGTSSGEVQVRAGSGDGPTYVHNKVNASARAHIALDKKEGRWS